MKGGIACIYEEVDANTTVDAFEVHGLVLVDDES